MAIPQRKFREIVFQMIYSEDLNKDADREQSSSLFDQLMTTKKTLRQARDKMICVMKQKEQIDRLITQACSAYDFKRITRVERNILRLGVFELLYEERVPPKVVFAEAVRLSRKFSSPEGGGFVNAILDVIYHSKEKER